ncbi:endonuclease/exonuclease/phosphatase family protein [Shewanella intestini]|uniref:Endonuclease/exonuclease/phosphatase family protein n=1 Tax=Shewanella intestini TaxID=2017544 RepID=A0ABS5I7P8_9GAMM|nr:MULTISPECIES: endonuclease/exonuclease/phosphatase family protein [Shewanella]MBR9729370.1 endonuclease/exonuclease/phosphatase family protein [Shewanella intestini]MRG37449.1 endonuclease [Shewanella sp. XMDDZSB0408]
MTDNCDDGAVSNSALAATSFRIASINLFNFIAPPDAYYEFENIYSTEQWLGKLTWFSDFVAKAKPDIIGFQEVFSPDALKEWANKQGYPYFAVVGEPELVSDYVYKSPVVALASKYPITQVSAVVPQAHSCQQLGLPSTFSFSRAPLRATVNLPHFGECDCYVIHFKSKRNQLDTTVATDQTLSGAAEFVAQQVLGRWGASLQRGSEATLLYHAMLTRRFSCGHPFVLMGDFNDSIQSDLFSAFRQSSRIFRSDINDVALSQVSDTELQAQLQQFGLFDSYELFVAHQKANRTLAHDEYETHSQASQLMRPASHYFGNTGSVLDYILVSSEFNHAAMQNLAHITHYQTFDRHLVRPDYERDKNSTDHAPVMMTFELRGQV